MPASLAVPALPRLRLVRGALAIVMAAIVVAAGAFSAQAALLLLTPVVAPHPLVSRAVPPPRVAAIPDAPPALASPARGATGTTSLPPEPAAGPVAPPEATVAAAAPFTLRGIGAADRGRAVECLAAAIYYEAASEPVDGQRAVAQVVLNRVRHPAFPATVCGVVYQGSERSGCQFSFACDGAMTRAPARDGWARATRLAAAALRGAVYAPVGLATHYHTYAVTPAWNRSLVMTDAVGAHFFHRWRGYWGTRAAFGQRYRGQEPAPGPHRVAVTAPAPALPVAIFDAVPVPAATPVAAPAPRAAPAAPPALPESQVLDRWKDSGAPLDRR